MNLHQKVFATLVAVAISAALPANADDVLVKMDGEIPVINWSFVAGWEAAQVREVFGPNVRMTNKKLTGKKVARPGKPKNPVVGPKPIPINPWCQCPVGIVVMFEKNLNLVKPPLSAQMLARVSADARARSIAPTTSLQQNRLQRLETLRSPPDRTRSSIGGTGGFSAGTSRF